MNSKSNNREAVDVKHENEIFHNTGYLKKSSSLLPFFTSNSTPLNTLEIHHAIRADVITVIIQLNHLHHICHDRMRA
jgi:hypothetical protein